MTQLNRTAVASLTDDLVKPSRRDTFITLASVHAPWRLTATMKCQATRYARSSAWARTIVMTRTYLLGENRVV